MPTSTELLQGTLDLLIPSDAGYRVDALMGRRTTHPAGVEGRIADWTGILVSGLAPTGNTRDGYVLTGAIRKTIDGQNSIP